MDRLRPPAHADDSRYRGRRATGSSHCAVWKFELRPGVPVVMPSFAKILSVGQQSGTPYLWALVNPGEPKVERDLLILGTGHDASKVGYRDFIGTITGVEGSLVLHVWDEEMPF